MFNALRIFEFAVTGIIVACFVAVVGAVVLDFAKFNLNDKAKKQKKSIVATGTMAMFYVFFYLVIKLRAGEIMINNLPLRMAFIFLGLAIIILGTFVNVKGRIDLGKNWSNHIKIYESHTLVAKGAYKFVRHPLYASLIWIFYGACLVYFNFYAFLLNTFVFLPFMYYRAKQEERMLEQEFSEYKNYKIKTGMFFPRKL